MTIRFAVTTSLLLLAGQVTPLLADDKSSAERGTLSLVYENDTFAGTDRNYTNGIDITYLSAPNAVPLAARWFATRLMSADPGDTLYGGVGIGQSIFTPSNTNTTAALPKQHPYAGWLHARVSTSVDSGKTLDTAALEVGLVGPNSGAEWVQNHVHDLLGADEANGWDNQIRDEFGFVLTYERKWRALAEWRAGGLGVDVMPNAAISVGNVLTQGAAGLTFRVGQDLANDYGPPRVYPALAGAGFFAPRDHFSWYLFVGVNGRAVAYNIVLDGNAFRDGGPSVNRKPLVAEGQAGLVMQLGRLQGAFTVVTRTDEFKGQGKQELFGAVSLSMKL
jgi:lipid A 3-O-deacylase